MKFTDGTEESFVEKTSILNSQWLFILLHCDIIIIYNRDDSGLSKIIGYRQIGSSISERKQ